MCYSVGTRRFGGFGFGFLLSRQLTVRMRSASEHPQLRVSDAEAERVRSVLAEGPKPGRLFAVEISDEDGGVLALPLGDVLWISDEAVPE